MKAVLLVLDQFSGQNRTCWPSTELIARCACCSCRAVQRAIDALDRLGFIDLLERDGRSRRWISNREYAINYDRLEDLVDETEHQATASRPPESEAGAPVDTSPPGRDAAAPVGATSRRPGCDATSAPGANKQEPLSAPTQAAGPSGNGAANWIDGVRGVLLKLGVDPPRVRPLCEEAGTVDRVWEILVICEARRGRIKNPARYFAHLCAHPEINPNAAEARRLKRRLDRGAQAAAQSSLAFI
ncbi:MAG: helix-turn-helix domain-containing protein [Myxococcota bacterium]